MVYVIAIFYDVNYKEDLNNHEEVCSKIFREDDVMIKCFTDK